MLEIEQVNFLINLCPRMQYFQVHDSKDMDLKMLARCVLRKTNTDIPHLSSLYFDIHDEYDKMVWKLRKMIDSDKLLLNYTINRINNYIVLKWKWKWK